MTTSNTKSNRKKEKKDDSLLSNNHSKSVKYRLRVQQDMEAKQEIKNYEIYSEETRVPD